jgi:hypothetical protein
MNDCTTPKTVKQADDHASAPVLRHALLACLIAAVSACGGGGNDSNAPTPPPPPSAPPPPPPAPVTYNIGGSVSGLTGSGLALQNNGSDTLAVAANGPFTFSTALANAAAYNVTVSTQPSGQTCAVNGGAGTVASAAVTNVAVTCTDNPPAVVAPVIVRQPFGVTTKEHGSALFFVVATGTDLNYEWRRTEGAGALLKSGPEPFVLDKSLGQSDDGDCYRVIVSNSAGSVVSESACVAVTEIEYIYNEDGGSVEPDGDLAYDFGRTLMGLVVNSTGPLTGPRLVGTTFFLGPLMRPSAPCLYEGSVATTLDGALISGPTQLPVGQHIVSLEWEECRDSPDDERLDGGFLMTYDFPQELGVGTYTIHFGGYRYTFNGSVSVEASRSVGANNVVTEEVSLVPLDDFSANGRVLFRQTATQFDHLDVTRRIVEIAGMPVADRAEVGFGQLTLAFYDADEIVGSISDTTTGDEVFEFDGDSSGTLSIHVINSFPSSSEFMGTLEPAGDGTSWSLELVFE